MYILEGNIGAGKSTFLTLLAQHCSHINIALEPVNNWQQHVHGQSLLANFYQNTARWAYTLETFAMICRVREHIKDQQHPNPMRVIERSIYSGHYCFSLNGYQQGYMMDLEWSLYNEWFSFLIPQTCRPPHGFIYLRVDPEVAFQRLKKRNRLAEKEVSLAYLKQIHEHHERFLVQKAGVMPEITQIPVLILECNEEFEKNAEQFDKHATAISDFMHATLPKQPTSYRPINHACTQLHDQ